MVARVRLRDGTEGVICPLLHGDREALAEAFDHLSPLSRFHRFMAPVEHLSEAMLDQLVDEVDGVDHVALVLFARPTDGPEVAVGVARVARYPDDPTTADVAVTVADDWQGRGVASALLPALMRRRPAGVTTLVTEVYYDNPASLAMLRRLGQTTVAPDGCGGMEVEVDLENGPLEVGNAGAEAVER